MLGYIWKLLLKLKEVSFKFARDKKDNYFSVYLSCTAQKVQRRPLFCGFDEDRLLLLTLLACWHIKESENPSSATNQMLNLVKFSMRAAELFKQDKRSLSNFKVNKMWLSWAGELFSICIWSLFFCVFTAGHQKQVGPDLFRVFYTIWKETEAEAQEVSTVLLRTKKKVIQQSKLFLKIKNTSYAHLCYTKSIFEMLA